MPRRAVVFLVVIFVAVGLDQGSKAWARTLPVHPAGCGVADLAALRCSGVPQPVIAGYWDWELAENRGAAFSSFAGEAAAQILLAIVAAGALIAIGIAAARTRPDQRLRRLGFALVAGGALGNLVDRVRDGAVTDFVRWHVHGHLWPIFNVADAALLVGITLLLIDGVTDAARRPRKAT